VIGAAVALIAGAAGAALYFHLGRVPDQLAKPSDRFSIVVLPFAKLSGDAGQPVLAFSGQFCHLSINGFHL
jgi:hypothetical protein